MPIALEDVTKVQIADVYKNGQLAARLTRENGAVTFTYDDDYLSTGKRAVATTLPLQDEPIKTVGGAVPPFFAGLLPEGRRLSGLRTAIKTSADDELSLLLAVGADVIGDVTIVPSGEQPDPPDALVNVDKSWSEVSFGEILEASGVVDPIGIPGVQDKASARMISTPVRDKSARYILKISPPEYPNVVENEAFFIDVARRAGVPAVDAEVIHDARGRSGLLVRRFDRTKTGALACEDACQVMGRWPADKYLVDAETVSNAIADKCAARTLALRDAFRQFCFAWMIGNGDMHAKNISILQEDTGEWRVAPAYDLPNTTVYGDHSFALNVNGVKKGLSRKRFLAYAAAIGLNERAANSVIRHMLHKTEKLEDEIKSAALAFPDKKINDLVRQIRDRRRLLAQSV